VQGLRASTVERSDWLRHQTSAQELAAEASRHTSVGCTGVAGNTADSAPIVREKSTRSRARPLRNASDMPRRSRLKWTCAMTTGS